MNGMFLAAFLLAFDGGLVKKGKKDE